MYYDANLKSFYESKNGKAYLALNHINVSLGELVNLLDSFYEDKIRVNEIIKDIDIIANDLKDNTTKFDYRRKTLFSSWLKDTDIASFLPLGHKSALKALKISYEIDLLLNDLDEEKSEYMYLVSLYLKQLFKYINDIKGVSVERWKK